jgi:hypothetical protein
MEQRPSSRLPLTVHRKLGTLLRQASVATVRERTVRLHIEIVRRTLKGWAREEYSETELPEHAHKELYYGFSGPGGKEFVPAAPIETEAECDRLLDMLSTCMDLIIESYPQGLETEALLISLGKAIMTLNKIKTNIIHFEKPQRSQ